MTDRQKATEILSRMYDLGVSPDQILEHIVYNFLSGSEALEALEALEDSRDEFIPNDEE